MSASDLAALVVILCSCVGATLLAVTTVVIRRRLKALDALLDGLEREAAAALGSLEEAAAEAEAELGRVDDLLDRADSITSTLQDASRLTYLAVSNPVIKAAALANGVRHGARRLRLGNEPEPEPAPPVRRRRLSRGKR